MKIKTLFLLSALAASATAAGRPEPPSGVFSCNGESKIRIKGESTQYVYDPYASTLYFPSSKKTKYALKSSMPAYVSNGSYWWADEKYWDGFHIMLQSATRIQEYRKLALATCKSIGWKCTATTYIGFNSAVKIVDDSNLDLSILNVTKIKAITTKGPTNLEMWTSSKAHCIKN